MRFTRNYEIIKGSIIEIYDDSNDRTEYQVRCETDKEVIDFAVAYHGQPSLAGLNKHELK